MRGAAALLGLFAMSLALAAAGPPAAATRPEETALEARIAEIARTAHGTVGVYAVHIESGRTASLNPERPFILQSTFKALVAGAVLGDVDRGRLALTTPVALLARDMAPGASPLSKRHPLGGVTVSVHELLDLMVTVSDNTACDALLRKLGGPDSVTAWLVRRGIRDARVNRNEFALGNNWYGLKPPPRSLWTARTLGKLREAVPAASRDSAAKAFLADPRDRATPAAYANFLAALQKGELLTPASTDTLLALLGRCATGVNRLPAGLPPGTRLAHKTGTGGTWQDGTNAVNDAGIVTLPGSGGHVALVVFVEDVRGPVTDAERVIAQIAREVFSHWNAPE